MPDGYFYVTIKDGKIALEGEKAMNFVDFPAYLRRQGVKGLLVRETTEEEQVCLTSIATAARVTVAKLTSDNMLSVSYVSEVSADVKAYCQPLERAE